jgi:choline kinase
MSFRVVIPTAGIGSRLGALTKFVNKSLVGIANRPTLSHLIEQFPPDAEFVIALGHQGHLVREFVALAYPERTFLFVDVAPFEGSGSGLGLSLSACREHLQQPFVFISCDTLVTEPIPAPDRNWMGYAEVDAAHHYRTLQLTDGKVAEICEKNNGDSRLAYIGLAGVHDHAAFWKAMTAGGAQTLETGESQGLRGLLREGVSAVPFTWYDTGNPEALDRTRRAYAEPDAPNILEKANEAIWFVDGQVIKFSDDKKFIANRVSRVEQLGSFVPQVTGSSAHMYRYAKVSGEVLSETIDLPLFGHLLDHCRDFWKTEALDVAGQEAFRATCLKFYRDKTYDRVDLFYSTFARQDGTESINGFVAPTLRSLLDALDWTWLADGMAGRFHGDFHFENILWDETTRRFTFLDWRQEFAGSLTTGDVYYDLAKLLHGLIINHGLIARDLYSVTWTTDTIEFDFHRHQMLVECERMFANWLPGAGFDRRKVWTLAALIYLNIAALHHHPYSLLLYALGKSMLMQQARELSDAH